MFSCHTNNAMMREKNNSLDGIVMRETFITHHDVLTNLACTALAYPSTLRLFMDVRGHLNASSHLPIWHFLNCLQETTAWMRSPLLAEQSL
jgi:hypothetical protein